MHSISRRSLLLGAAALGTGLLSAPLVRRATAADLSNLTVYGPPATPSVTLAHLVESGALSGHVAGAAFKVWRNPDEMRAGVASGSMAVTATPTYAAANMFNRGLPVRLLNVLTWGLLYIVTTEAGIAKMEDLAGKTVAVAFKNDMPDLVFRHVAAKTGLVPGKDITLHYVASPMEAIQLLLAGRVSVALASEPAATAAIMRGLQGGVEVHRAIDLQKEWGRVTGRAPRLPQAGVMVTEQLVERHPQLIAAIAAGLRRSTEWVGNNPASAGRLGAGYLDLKAPIIERSLEWSNLTADSAAEARADLEAMFAMLAESNPAVIGGRMPESRFFLG